MDPDIQARDVRHEADPALTLVHIEDAAILVKRLAKSPDGHPCVDVDEIWRRVGTVAQVQIVRDGLNVRTWRAVPDGGERAVVGATRKAAVAGLLGLMGLRWVPATVTMDPLFEV